MQRLRHGIQNVWQQSQMLSLGTSESLSFSRMSFNTCVKKASFRTLNLRTTKCRVSGHKKNSTMFPTVFSNRSTRRINESHAPLKCALGIALQALQRLACSLALRRVWRAMRSLKEKATDNMSFRQGQGAIEAWCRALWLLRMSVPHCRRPCLPH